MPEETNNAPKSEGNNGGADLSQIDSVEKLPKWAQDELSRARNEAATYRTRLRDAKSEVEAEVRESVKQEVQDLTGKLSDLEMKLSDADLKSLKLEAALEVGVPGEHLKAFSERLRGTTADELRADAEAAKSMFGFNASNKATDPTAGLGGNEPKKTPESAMGDFIIGKLSR